MTPIPQRLHLNNYRRRCDVRWFAYRMPNSTAKTRYIMANFTAPLPSENGPRKCSRLWVILTSNSSLHSLWSGFSREAIYNYFNDTNREHIVLCKCHFISSDFVSGALSFGCKPYGAHSVQQNLLPTSDNPQTRVNKRTLAGLGLSSFRSPVHYTPIIPIFLTDLPPEPNSPPD